MAPRSRTTPAPSRASRTRVEAAPPSSRRRSWPLSLRETFRFVFSLTLLVALVEYVRFADYVRTGAGAAVSRPVVADAFLPLAGVAALKTWLATGLWDQFHPVALVVLLAVLVTAWLCRRAACSWLCPFGLVSEYLSKLGTKLLGRQLRVPRWLDRTLLAINTQVRSPCCSGCASRRWARSATSWRRRSTPWRT